MKIASVVFKKDGKPKEGRGFSREELKKVALDSKKALRLGIPIDLRRRTLHEENVKVLNEHLKTVKTVRKPKKKVV